MIDFFCNIKSPNDVPLEGVPFLSFSTANLPGPSTLSSNVDIEMQSEAEVDWSIYNEALTPSHLAHDDNR